jgi:spore coat polysaccharide biosynthesis protein SpsF (cytidylyltransferase family)
VSNIKKKNYLTIIQARTGATRLPNKVLLKVKGKTMLEYEISRVSQAKKIDKIVVATTDNPADNTIVQLCRQIGIDYFRGLENDVLARYYYCSLQYPEFKNIVRLTGDCPLIDPAVIDQVIDLFEKDNCDYAANILEETFPDGLDTEVFTQDCLAQAFNNAKKMSEREHVTLYIRNQKRYKKSNLLAPKNYGAYRLVLDRSKDFVVLKFLIEKLGANKSYLDYVSFLEQNPKVKAENQSIIRNEGLLKSLKNDFEIH